MLEYSREALAKFIRVEAEFSDGSVKRFYGGDQSWFESENGRAGGCGTVAAANILAYFGIVLGADGALRRTGLAADSRDLSRADYLAHMHRVYAGLTPLVPPWKTMAQFRPGLEEGGGLGDKRGGEYGRRRSILRLPESLGIHNPVRFADAVLALAKKEGVDLRVVWPQNRNVRWPVSQSMSLLQAKSFILGQIEKGFPVAMLNFNNRGLRHVEYKSVVSGRIFSTDRFQWHWVVITGIEADAVSGREFLVASSWGNRVSLDLERFWGRGLTQLVSFEMIEKG